MGLNTQLKLPDLKEKQKPIKNFTEIFNIYDKIEQNL